MPPTTSIVDLGPPMWARQAECAYRGDGGFPIALISKHCDTSGSKQKRFSMRLLGASRSWIPPKTTISCLHPTRHAVCRPRSSIIAAMTRFLPDMLFFVHCQPSIGSSQLGLGTSGRFRTYRLSLHAAPVDESPPSSKICRSLFMGVMVHPNLPDGRSPSHVSFCHVDDCKSSTHEQFRALRSVVPPKMTIHRPWMMHAACEDLATGRLCLGAAGTVHASGIG
eukprot:2727507-Rhodomonas_salina.4